MEKLTMEELKNELRGFRGTSAYYRPQPLLLPHLLLTDGTKYLAEKAKCYWLMNLIAELQLNPKIKNHPELRKIQFWRLHVYEKRDAHLIVEWDTDKEVYRHHIKHTDFPVGTFTLYAQAINLEYIGKTGKGWVCHLPSEY
ncbi:MAG: DUF6876 family protein [Cyanobacteria bacterium P01_F01_bin.143]